MSALSMADMRRIGERRNTETLSEEPTRSGLLPKLSVSLPFSSRSKIDHANPAITAPPVPNSHAIDQLNRLQGEQQTTASSQSPTPAPVVRKPAAPVAADPYAEMPTRLSAMTANQAAAPLRSDTTIKAGIGAGLGAAAGFAATGTVIALPAGLVLGGMSGMALAKRGQTTTIKNKSVSVKRKQAERLFVAFEDICVPFAINTPTIAMTIDQSAAFQLSCSGNPTKRKLDLTIGLPLLAGLSAQQVQALFAQALGRLLELESIGGESVPAALVANLDQMLAKRSKKKAEGSSNRQALTRHVQSAHFAWSSAAADLDRAADRRAAQIVGSAALVDAILAQGLIAQRFYNGDDTFSFQDRMDELRAGYGQSELNLALQGLASSKGDAQAYLCGIPLQLLDRITALDTSIPVPRIPAGDPASGSLDPKLLVSLGKKLLGIKFSRSKTTSVNPKKVKPAKAPRTSLFARFKRKASATNVPATTGDVEPLYDADALFKTDAGVGLEAYQGLVDAHPRWALARLRLAEAQIECGIGDGVANLMMAAEQLPSAMPTILGALQSALPMVSPLEEEPLRQAIERMWTDADAMAAERAQIDLLRLEPPRMDEADLATLRGLFASAPGLREAWVFNVPCVHAPEVPHHAILGLAPRLTEDGVEVLAMQIAEHASILGTVAVHIETGTPRGGLGDALASQPSLWRAGRT